jgi:hypothetical protein
MAAKRNPGIERRGGLYDDIRQDDLVGVRFRVGKSQAAGREIGDFMTVPRSRPG